jgi:hypothetical protein
MLGGLDPVIIFQFKVLAPILSATVAKIPLVSKVQSFIDMPPIPVYLSEKTFSILIGGTSKSIDIETETQGQTKSATPPDVNQNPIQSSVEIEIVGKQDNVALTLLSSLIDQVYERATSKEYAISFLYGATTIFNAVLHSYSAETVPGTDQLSVKIRLSKGSKNPVKKPVDIEVPGSTGSIPVGAA